MKPSTAQIKKMIAMAKETRKHAFAHRSDHKIGASVLINDGEIFGGCNIESVISGLGTCAERNAIDHAIAHGKYNIIAVCALDEKIPELCGACLQYLMLFSQMQDKDIFIISADPRGRYKIAMLSELLPSGYKTMNNLKKIRSYNRKKSQ